MKYRFPLLVRGSLVLLATALGACTASVEGGASPNTSAGTGSSGGGQTSGGTSTGSTAGGATGATSGTAGGAALLCVKAAVGPSPLRRLTHTEYNNSVADLLGDQTHPASEFPDDTQQGLFDNTAAVQTVPVLLAGGYVDTAVTLARGVSNLTTLVGCDFAAAGANGTTCLRGFVQRFGRRAFRRPLTPDETTRLMALAATTLTDKQMGVRVVIAGILASPHFLFRPEFGTTESTIPGAQHATPFEIAGRLGSLLWSSVPDEMLLDEAQAGRLATREQIATQARRMLADPRARPAVAAFYEQFLGLAMVDVASKDQMVYPAFTDTLRNSMHEETRRFVANVIWDDDARLVTLLTAPYSFVNAPLAELYGVKGPTDATTFSKVMLDPTQRAGVLTQGSMLAAFARPDESSPVKRGKWVRTRMLCGDLPDPPNNVPELPALPDGISNRERFAMHTSNIQCSGCHHLVDGLGFGLERYDGIGRYRTTDNGVAVDSNGEVTDTTDINGKYNGAPELAALLARSGQVRDCLPTQWMRYTMARREVADDACSLKAVRDSFASSGGNLRELMVSLTQTDAFMNYRRAD
jgi:Protein of unknown function (DUF1592)/Protein of unknown function (DUF1588)/Protein of unknown function (DUF1595)/Protein of unknown function (DUF1587)/Protein of unknown function (DUF1585)